MAETRHKEPGEKISKTFCILPWIHLHTWPNGNVFPCCIVDFRENIGNLKDNTLEEIWNNDSMKGIRKDMMGGKKPNICRKCFEQESHNIDSSRITANRNFYNKIDGITDNTDSSGYNSDFKLHYWDFRFSNLCNMKCRTCGSGCSSKWFEDEYKLIGHNSQDRALIHVDDYSKKGIGYYIDEFIEDVEEIYFAGGEPLLMDEHYYILEKLIEIGNTDVRLRYNTNLSFLKYKKWDILELWSNFKDVTNKTTVDVYASIDGVGKKAEFIRKGSNWNTIKNNIQTCIENKIDIKISCTVSIFNILDIPKIVNYLSDIGIKLENIGLYNVLTFPDYYRVDILSEELKQIVCERLDIHLDTFNTQDRNVLKGSYDSLKSYLYKNDSDNKDLHRHNLKKYSKKLDEIRGESFEKHFPEIWEWLDPIS